MHVHTISRWLGFIKRKSVHFFGVCTFIDLSDQPKRAGNDSTGERDLLGSMKTTVPTLLLHYTGPTPTYSPTYHSLSHWLPTAMSTAHWWNTWTLSQCERPTVILLNLLWSSLKHLPYLVIATTTSYWDHTSLWKTICPDYGRVHTRSPKNGLIRPSPTVAPFIFMGNKDGGLCPCTPSYWH